MFVNLYLSIFLPIRRQFREFCLTQSITLCTKCARQAPVACLALLRTIVLALITYMIKVARDKTLIAVDGMSHWFNKLAENSTAKLVFCQLLQPNIGLGRKQTAVKK